MRLIPFLFLVATIALAQSPILPDAELLRAAAAGKNGLVPIRKTEWYEVNIARKAQSIPPMSYGEVCTNAACNTIAFTTRLLMVETEIMEPFVKVNKRVPAPQEVLAAWMVGVPKFEKLKYDFTKIEDPVVKLAVQKYDYEKRLQNLSRWVSRPVPPMPGEIIYRDTNITAYWPVPTGTNTPPERTPSPLPEIDGANKSSADPRPLPESGNVPNVPGPRRDP